MESTTLQHPVDCQLRDSVSPTDREAIRRIVESTGYFQPHEVDVALELVDDYLADGPESGYRFVIADRAGQTVGYACYGPIPCTATSYDLYWVAVDPSVQRAGIGRCLVKHLEERVASAGGERIYIDTSGKPQYTSTRAFYERCEYQLAARLADFYAPGDDRCIYVRVLPTSSQPGSGDRP